MFFNDITTCLRLPACDQIVIVDCCFAATAFAREPIGKQKFELLTSAGAHNKVPAPGQPGSFTHALLDVLRTLLSTNPRGFCTSALYRELFHSIPQDIKTKPMLFDQSRQSYGKIWLRPQEGISEKKTVIKKEGRFLNLTLQLNEEPNDVVMNDLALALQYLPHVDQVRFVDLYAPRHQIESFMRSILLAQKLRPLVRKLQVRMQLRKLKRDMAQNEKVVRRSASFLDLLFKPDSHPIYDWSSARGPGESLPARPRQKSFTWPPSAVEQPSKTKTLSNRYFSLDYKVTSPNYTAFRSRIFHHCHHTIAFLSRSTKFAAPTSLLRPLAQQTQRNLSASNMSSTWSMCLDLVFHEDTWHAITWVAVWYIMASICVHKSD